MGNINKAREQFQSLMSSFNSKQEELKARSTKASMLSNNYNTEMYDINYSGAYFDKEKDKLVILMDNKTDYNVCEDILSSDVIEYKQSKYSLTELLNLQELIYNVLTKYNISSSGISQKDNKVLVSFSDDKFKDDFIEYIKSSNIDLDMLEITKNLPKPIHLNIDYAGNKMYCEANGKINRFTIGFNGYIQSSPTNLSGFVTAAHCHRLNGIYKTSGGYYVGPDSGTIYKYGGYYDVMFIPFAQQNNWSNSSIYKNFLSAQKIGNIYNTLYISSSMEGDTVCKYGAITGRESGTILEAFFNFNNEKGISFKDFFKSSCIGKPGDSGGPIGIETGSTVGSKKLSLIGITSSGEMYEGDDHTINTFGCKMTNIFGNVAFPYTSRD